MSMYGAGLSFGEAANLSKMQIKHALEGEKCVGEDENGFIWASCSEDEANDEILAIFDECVHQVIEAMHDGRALEKMVLEKYEGMPDYLSAYQKAFAATEMVSDYVFEGEQCDVPDAELDK